MDNAFNRIQLLSDVERFECRTRLNAKSVFVGNIMRGATFREQSQALKQALSKNDLIYYREVKRFVDVYSWKTNTLSLHPSTYYFLDSMKVERVLTYSKDKKRLLLTQLCDFDSILDLGIGSLRRVAMRDCKQFEGFEAVNLKLFYKVDSVSTPVIVDELLKVKKDKPKDLDPNQGSLFR